MQHIRSFIDAERKFINKYVDMDKKKTTKSRNIKHSKLTIDYFFKKAIVETETIIMLLEMHTHN
jgi:hypothetical protein